MHESMDLDINNYELTDILNLFKLPVMFDDKHLKQAKVTVLHMHPDKSKLPKDVKKENFDSEFQSFLNENIPKEKHITDRNGNVRVFVLRNSAAKEAHVKNGEVHKHPKGYIVKLKEENINELYANEFNSMDSVYSQTVPATTAAELSKGRASARRKEKPALAA
jgi:hypothetical protein